MHSVPAHMRTEPVVHDHFGKYQVVARLGMGGMAEVFKCRLSGIGGFDKVVVIKRIRPELVGQPQFLEMFLDEARIAASLSHGNIVQTFEIDQAWGVPFLVMEYVRGPTLSELTRKMRGRPNLPLAAKVISGVCAGLDHAHHATDESGASLGIIHRDVSPQNILVSLDGVPKVFDFGVAKAHGQLAQPDGTVKGKFMYMPPEAFPGDPAQISPQFDVFAAGVCLYHATTFCFPYRGEKELDVLRAAARGDFVRPSALVPGFCPRLEELILWAMAPNREARCPDALTLHRQLEEYAQRHGCTQTTVVEQLRGLFTLGTDPAIDPEIHSVDIVLTPPGCTLSPRPLPVGRCASLPRPHRWSPKRPQAPQAPERKRVPLWLLLATVALMGAEALPSRVVPSVAEASVPQPTVAAPRAVEEAPGVCAAPPAPRQVPPVVRRPRFDPPPSIAAGRRAARLLDTAAAVPRLSLDAPRLTVDGVRPRAEPLLFLRR